MSGSNATEFFAATDLVAAFSRQGSYYYHRDDLAAFGNPSSPYLWVDFTVNAGSDIVTRSQLVPIADRSPSYDLDGNLTFDGYYDYTWDAENRLIGAEVRFSVAPLTAPVDRVTFDYDYLGRRVRKQIFRKQDAQFILVQDRKFIYDGWNLVAEFENDAPLRPVDLERLGLSELAKWKRSV